ncbi:hypothetical protein E4U12_006689 [Claviceps purpurea]|nr:hypothetical protein E4U12_006689 [Claviceps purpurea]KAG6221859.1 hypothetical protein E4U26_005691 [Claviceps purpurea]KAG6260919.1 hypothetical protein E4U49_004411 [Claviceps purpurea]KAG6294167.1 hypothetical protein E4U45_006409 [Claviceps purpurea]
MASAVASASSITLLESLPARPPTPPREAFHETDIALEPLASRTLAFDPRLSLQTPPNGNPPTFFVATDPDSNPSRAQKRVEWSAHTDYREAPQFHNSLKSTRFSSLSAPSSTSSKPVKGILKTSSSPNTTPPWLGNATDGSSAPVVIIEMLDSSIRQLAGSNRDSKLDAYMMLSRALKASSNLPDRVALHDKMSLFMQFIQRDMTAKTSAGVLDSSLINHSLTLLATFLHFPGIASTLTTDFGVFVMEHSIRSFEDQTMPKDVVRHLMQVVAFQNFSPKVVTSDRVGRLVAAVHSIENHLKGKSIVMSRLHIYKRLVKQSRIHMATHCDWLKDMFTDMLSTVKEIRSQAINLGMEAGFTLVTEKQLFRKVTDIFQTTSDTETYIEFYIKRLQYMIKERQTCAVVPQIWSVVNLFLRCPLDRWHYYGPWLTLVQSAFNMTDSLTKQEANFAWNRYVYLTVSDSKVSAKTISTLCQPLLSQLRRKTNPRQREEAMKLRRVVIGGICNLYYYTFAPGSDKHVPDIIWDVAVKPIIGQLRSLDDKSNALGDGVTQAARLLFHLLDVRTPRIWRQDRIMDHTPVEPDELPAIDSKWIRKNCDKVIECVGPIIRQGFCHLEHKDSLVYRLWQALITSVAAASAKDIKVSDETAKFVACAFELLSEVITSAAVATEAGADIALPDAKLFPCLSNYIQLLIIGLGILPFTEKRLSMTVSNTFKPVSTPSHRPDRKENSCDGIVRLPLHHLFVMLSSIRTNCADHGHLSTFFLSVFGPFLRNKSAKGQLHLSIELLHLTTQSALSPVAPWLFTANCAKACLEAPSPNTAASSIERMLGSDYGQIVSLLERGLTSHSGLTSTSWLSLLQVLAARVTREFGDAGCCLIVVEPLAKKLYALVTSSKDRPSTLVLAAIMALFSLTKSPRDKQALEAARSKLWGAPSSLAKITSIQPLEALAKLGNYILSYLYQRYDDIDLDVSLFMETIFRFLDKNSVAGLTAVVDLQSGLDKWIQDDEAILTSGCQSSLLNIVSSMWDHICSKIVAHCQVMDNVMGQIEPLLMSGFKSKCSDISVRTALTWNAIIANNEDVSCSDDLKSIISAVASTVDIFRQGGSRVIVASRCQKLPLVQDGDERSVTCPSRSTAETNTGSAIDAPVAGSLRCSLGRKQRVETTPETTRSLPNNRASDSKLRHEDSQIQFERIASSSPLQEESQHLTERQKEVRQRQRSTPALYSDAPSTSPPATVQVLSRCNSIGGASESDEQVQQSTPKQKKSFEDLISSTPTPRRGEFLQMDDFNDPPSSPLVPRPFPLLSEIQSRSRAGTLDDWKFSSPPPSPTETLCQRPEDAQRSAAPAEELPLVRSLRSSRKQQKVGGRAREHVVEAATSKVAERERVIISEAAVQQLKPSEGAITRARKAHEAPKSEAIAPTKVESTPTRRSHRQSKLELQSEEDTALNVDSSFDAATTSTSEFEMKTEVAGQSTMQPQLAETTVGDTLEPVGPYGCTVLHMGSVCSSTEQLKEVAIQDLPSVVPSTPARTAESAVSSVRRRKRKRQSKEDDAAHKKMCASVDEGTEVTRLGMEPVNNLVSAPEHDFVNAMETRSGLRKRQSQGDINEKKSGRSSVGPAIASHAITDGGDTDDEVFSQLVTESHAASQQSLSQQDSVEVPHDDPFMKHTAAASDQIHVSRQNDVLAQDDEAQTRANSVVGGTDKTASIVESLKGSLEQLRSASLTREKVYEVEDILMDMKRELFEAERRGRVQPRPARPRKRSSRRR